MAYRFGIGSLPGPRFTTSNQTGAGLFFANPTLPQDVDADKGYARLPQGRFKKRPLVKWNHSDGKLAQLLAKGRPNP